MTKQVGKTPLFLIAFFLLTSLVVVFIYRRPIKRFFIGVFRSDYGTTRGCPGCAEYFPDVVSVMDRAYKNDGIKPQRELEDLDELYRRGILAKIVPNKYYDVDRMEDSRPYVLPTVIIFLRDLSVLYEKKLKEKQLSYIPFVINSGTRSIVSAAALAKRNKLARAESHHLMGKTLDISYVKFGSRRSERICFIEALYQLRKQGRCYVKYETKGALHTTVR